MLPTAVIAALTISVCGCCLQPSAALTGLFSFGRRLVKCSCFVQSRCCLHIAMLSIVMMLPTAVVAALAIGYFGWVLTATLPTGNAALAIDCNAAYG
jgi:hypothetical protein